MKKIIFLMMTSFVLVACGNADEMTFEEYYVKDAQERGNDIDTIDVIASQEIDNLKFSLIAHFDDDKNYSGASLAIHEILPDKQGWENGNATGCTGGPKTLVGYGDYVALCGVPKEDRTISSITTDTGNDDEIDLIDYEDSQIWWMVHEGDYDLDDIQIAY